MDEADVVGEGEGAAGVQPLIPDPFRDGHDVPHGSPMQPPLEHMASPPPRKETCRPGTLQGRNDGHPVQKCDNLRGERVAADGGVNDVDPLPSHEQRQPRHRADDAPPWVVVEAEGRKACSFERLTQVVGGER